MSALYLYRLLNQAGAVPTKITLVESPDVEIIGVGESTFDHMRAFLSDMAIREPEFLEKVDATFKHGILFRNWLTEEGDEYFHPFEFPQKSSHAAIVPHWLNLFVCGKTKEGIADSVGFQFKAAKAKKSPREVSHRDYSGSLPYAYHLDAVLVGKYFRSIALERGVQYRIDHCVGVSVSEEGNIQSIKLKSGESVEADFFIDCTGYANVLTRAIGNDDFLSYEDYLLCDRAVAARIPQNKEDEWSPRPYTTSTAQESGWIWDIDLYRRKGVGYVYSYEFSNEDRSEAVLRKYIGKEQCEIDVRHLKMRVGRLRKFWSKNCVAIGLSGGFIEPLESTGILFIDMGLRFLGEMFPTNADIPYQRDHYNRTMRSFMDSTRDFIVLHYALSRRNDSPFWRAVKEKPIPEGLQSKMELWRHKMPTKLDFATQVSTFSDPSYAFIMYGLHWQHDTIPGTVAHLDTDYGRRIIDAMASEQRKFLDYASAHAYVIEQLRSSAGTGGN